MAQVLLEFRSNIDEFCSTVERLAEYLNTAPEGDPVKAIMLAYGELDLDRHITQEVSCLDGIVTLTFGFKRGLQAIVDMVPSL